MKKLTIILIFAIMANASSAHNHTYENIVLRHWSIPAENRVVEGTFLMIKNNQVFIEDANSRIVSMPISSLSAVDRAFALKKAQKTMEYNSHTRDHNHERLQIKTIDNEQRWLIALLVFTLGFILILNKETLRVKYMLPMLCVGMVLTIVGFKGRMIRAMQTFTSPGYIDSAFVPFKPNVNTFWDTTYFYVESKGIPTTHNMMVGISNHGWQQQVPIPQCYMGANAWPIPLNPILSNNPIPVDSVHFTRGAIAIAVNGVPIFNVHTNTGVDSYIDGQLDNYGGHCGRGDDYHYHTAPLHLYNHTSTTLPIAFGLDGYAVFGDVEPDGSPMQSLDANHGHLFNGKYHYHGTASAPYMIAKMAGQVTEDNTHQLIPQALAHPVRPGLTPLNGALITACTPNAANNGYNLTYTRNGFVDSVVYNWNNNGQYNFKFYTNGNLDSTMNYNGFVQCSLPVSAAVFSSYATDIDIQIFPNPSHGEYQFTLLNESDQKNVKSLTIFNLQGDVVFRASGYQPQISLSELSHGIYYLQVQLRNKQITKKLIIQ